MQRIVSRENSNANQATGVAKTKENDGLVKHWKSRAQKLADLVLRQELQKRELQKEVNILKEAQSLPQDAEEIAELRTELLSAKDKLLEQAADLTQRENLLKEAAGAARKEVTELQQVNKELRAEVERLIQENKGLEEKARSVNSSPVKQQLPAATTKDPSSVTGFYSCYTSPGKAHMDIATLQSMLRQRDGEVAVLKEDNVAKQEELLHTLQSLQAAQKRAEDLRCQTASLTNQIDILREALRQRDGDVDIILGDMEQYKAVQNALEAREHECHRLQDIVTESSQQLAGLKHQLQTTVDEASMLRAALRERDTQVEELTVKMEDLQSRFSALQERVSEDNVSRPSTPVGASPVASTAGHQPADVKSTDEKVLDGHALSHVTTAITTLNEIEDEAVESVNQEMKRAATKKQNDPKKHALSVLKMVIIARIATAVIAVLDRNQ